MSKTSGFYIIFWDENDLMPINLIHIKWMRHEQKSDFYVNSMTIFCCLLFYVHFACKRIMFSLYLTHIQLNDMCPWLEHYTLNSRNQISFWILWTSCWKKIKSISSPFSMLIIISIHHNKILNPELISLPNSFPLSVCRIFAWGATHSNPGIWLWCNHNEMITTDDYIE